MSTTGSERSRRAIKARTSQVSRSAQCTSSASNRIGLRTALSVRSESVARPTRNRSGGAVSSRTPKAARRADCWRGGSRRTRFIRGRSASSSAANGKCTSDGIPAISMTAIPQSCARSRATSSSAVFPIPGSPLRRRADPFRSISLTRRSISSRHAARPWRTGRDRRDPVNPPFARPVVLARRTVIVGRLRKTEAFQGDYTECRLIQSDGGGFHPASLHDGHLIGGPLRASSGLRFCP